MNGVAEVVAPAERIRVERPDLPEISVRHYDSFKDLFEAVAPSNRFPPRSAAVTASTPA